MNALRSIYYLLFLAVLFSLVSCGDDDTNPPSGDPPSTDNDFSAVVAALRVSTPSGRIQYMGAYETLPKELDFKDMVELGTAVTVYAYGKHPYVYSGTASTLTKYDVSSTYEISVSDELNLTSTGLSGNFGPPAFTSETRAFFFALSEGKIIEFNPETMSITETIDVAPLALSDNPEINTTTFSSYVTDAGKILLPIAANPSDFDKFPQFGQVAVFDIDTKTVSYVSDTRMSMGYDTFAEGNDGSFYYRPARNTARAEDYSSITGHPTTGGLLKVNNDGTFDPDFFLDLKEILNAHSANIVPYVYDGKALVQYMDASHVPPSDPAMWFRSPTKFALLDLETKEFEAFTAFEELGTVYTVGEIDGEVYYGNFGASSGKYSVLRQNGAKDFEIVSEPMGGSCGYIGQLK